jgi:hypothetical protein
MADVAIPFITFYTPTFRRPKALAACLSSVNQQTIAGEIEHLVIPDYVGVGIAGMYERVPTYVDAVHGRYVHLLADDDVLASPHVVAALRSFAEARNNPPVIIVRVVKHLEEGALMLPLDDQGPPVMGRIDLGCIVTRADVWKAHANDYGKVYEGDFFFAKALWDAGHQFVYTDLFFLQGAVMRGRAEA